MLEGPNRFVILFVGRSGSTFLQESLDAHSSIRADGERFGAYGVISQVRRMEEYLTSEHGVDAVGFKTKLRDVRSPTEFASMLHERDVRVICLLRWNLVKQAISHANAVRLHERTGEWNRRRPVDLGKLTVEPRQLIGDMERIAAERRTLLDFVADVGRPALVMQYEDLLSRPEESFELAFRFLGVDSEPVTSSTTKNTADDLRTAVENYEELCSALVGTGYETMLDGAADRDQVAVER